jgi:hypothetical protein
VNEILNDDSRGIRKLQKNVATVALHFNYHSLIGLQIFLQLRFDGIITYVESTDNLDRKVGLSKLQL